jgi:hypothetical protein
MGLVFNRQQQRQSFWGIQGAQQLIPTDRLTPGQRWPRPLITNDDALRHSAVWAAVRLRADLLSTLPLEVYTTDADGFQIPATAPRVIAYPGGDNCDSQEWLYNSQVELDRSGNSIGVIRETDRDGYPTRIDLKPTSVCSVMQSGDELTGYRIAGNWMKVDRLSGERPIYNTNRDWKY